MSERCALKRRVQARGGAGGFHYAVLAIPVGGMEKIAGDLMDANQGFSDMVERSSHGPDPGVPALDREVAEELGHPHGGDSVAASFVEPLDTYCDMGQTLDRETWPNVTGRRLRLRRPRGHPGESQKNAETRVANAEKYSPRRSGISRTGRGGRSPARRTGRGQRFDDQYFRANIADWERYVITPAGTVQPVAPGASGFGTWCLPETGLTTGSTGAVSRRP